MTITNKLRYGFGAILAVVLLLFVVNTAVVLRQRAVSRHAAVAVESAQTLTAVELKFMEGRLALKDYLLSGDPRQQERFSAVMASFVRLAEDGQRNSPNPSVRDALGRIAQSQAAWASNFATPLIEARRRVDSGESTAAELQIAYIEKDPAVWSTASAEAMNGANVVIRTTINESTAAASLALSIGTMVSLGMTILAVFLCLGIAYHAANSITRPMNATVTVLRSIAEGEGDLTQRVNQSSGTSWARWAAGSTCSSPSSRGSSRASRGARKGWPVRPRSCSWSATRWASARTRPRPRPPSSPPPRTRSPATCRRLPLRPRR
jgi:methyl-accepting chemotaxis protein